MACNFATTNCSWASVQRRSQAQCHFPLRVLHNVRLDLCMAVHVVPVPCPPALSIMACCSVSRSWCSLTACTASAADKNLDCSFAWALSRATLADGTWSIFWTGARRTTSAASLSRDHGLASSPAALKMHHGVVGNSDSRRKQINPRSQCGRYLWAISPQTSLQGVADVRHHTCTQATADQYVA